MNLRGYMRTNTMLRTVIGLLSIFGLIVTMSMFIERSASAADSQLTSTVYQSTRPSNEASLLTTLKNEADTAASKYGYSIKDELFLASTSQKTGLVPVYRIYKPSTGDFVITMSVSERDLAVAKWGYVDQGERFYVSPKDTSTTEPVYRYIKGPMHRYALSPSDQKALEKTGWRKEKTAYYAAPTKADASQFNPVPNPPTPPVVPPKPPTPPVVPPSTGIDGDGVFSIAIIPDTQRELYQDNEPLFEKRFQWLVSQRSGKDVRFVTQTGDLVDWGSNARDKQNQYEHASKGIRYLDNDKFPYILSVGNHDTGAVCQGGSACPGVSVPTAFRDTSIFNRYFPSARQNIPLSQEFETNKVDNAYKLFNAEGAKWLALTVEMNPRKAVVDWVEQVVKTHPDYNVIVTSHYLLEGNGAISNSNSGYGATSARTLYDRVLLKYPNVKFAFSGHVGTAASRIDTGVNGNKVVSMVGTLHESNYNPTRIVTIDTKSGRVSAEITAQDIKESYKKSNPGAKVPNYSRFNINYIGMKFIK